MLQIVRSTALTLMQIDAHVSSTDVVDSKIYIYVKNFIFEQGCKNLCASLGSLSPLNIISFLSLNFIMILTKLLDEIVDDK